MTLKRVFNFFFLLNSPGSARYFQQLQLLSGHPVGHRVIASQSPGLARQSHQELGRAPGSYRQQGLLQELQRGICQS